MLSVSYSKLNDVNAKSQHSINITPIHGYM